MLNFVDLDQDPAEEVLMILEIFREMDPEVNGKCEDERRKKKQVKWSWLFWVYFSFFCNICMLKELVYSEVEFLPVYILFIYIHFANLFIFFIT